MFFFAFLSFFLFLLHSRLIKGRCNFISYPQVDCCSFLTLFSQINSGAFLKKWQVLILPFIRKDTEINIISGLHSNHQMKVIKMKWRIKFEINSYCRWWYLWMWIDKYISELTKDSLKRCAAWEYLEFMSFKAWKFNWLDQ